jgi:uncharacterized LabA/DUF88 family protein
MGIEGIKPWKKFYEAIHSVLVHDYGDCEVTYHFYGALPPRDDKGRFFNRKRFFEALRKDGIETHQGFCQSFQGVLQEKGVDMMVGLDLLEFSLNQYDLLFLFSADADIVPAVERAKSYGAKVVAILADQQPAKLMKNAVDGVVPLDAVIDLIDKKHILRRSNIQNHFKGEMSA